MEGYDRPVHREHLWSQGGTGISGTLPSSPSRMHILQLLVSQLITNPSTGDRLFHNQVRQRSGPRTQTARCVHPKTASQTQSFRRIRQHGSCQNLEHRQHPSGVKSGVSNTESASPDGTRSKLWSSNPASRRHPPW